MGEFKPPNIPLIGFRGLLFIIGFIIGVAVNKFLDSQEALSGEVFSGLKWLDIVNIGIPLALMVFVKKWKSLFIGWLLGALGTTIIDTVQANIP